MSDICDICKKEASNLTHNENEYGNNKNFHHFTNVQILQFQQLELIAGWLENISRHLKRLGTDE